jgi:hypothetical protein
MRKALSRRETVQETTDFYGKTMSIEGIGCRVSTTVVMRYIGERGGGCTQ